MFGFLGSGVAQSIGARAFIMRFPLEGRNCRKPERKIVVWGFE